MNEVQQKVPFQYGLLAGGIEFTNREVETARLISNLTTGTPTMLISPRRWGKSSLVRKATDAILRKNKNFKVCSLDLYNVRTEQEFYQEYALAVLKANSNKWVDLVNSVKKFFRNITPNLSISPDPNSEISISIDIHQARRNSSEILNLPEVIAKSKKIKMLVCIDEFQNIGFFEDPLAFQKKLRAHFQLHKHTNYCLYGSKRHMMMDIFTKPSMPFYKFGDIVFLEKIKTKDWVKFIVKRFAQTGKNISTDLAEHIALLVSNHPYFVQMLAKTCWQKTKKTCSKEVINFALNEILNHSSMMYQRELDLLTNMQVNYLKAMCKGETQFSSTAVMQKYLLGTSANVIKIRKALEEREIIDTIGGIEFVDPVFRIWLNESYFR